MDDSSTPSPPSPSTPPTPRILWIGAATLIVIAAVLIVLNIGPRDVGPDGKPEIKPESTKLTAEAVSRLLTQRDLAIGYLENHQFDRAESVLLEIIRQVPDDPFGPRNLTICRELALDKIDKARESDKFQTALATAREASDRLTELEPESHVPLVLRSRIAMKSGDVDRAAAALKRASELAPKAAGVWYDQFLLKPISPGEPPADETVDALRHVYELESDNLFVLKDWLPLQAQIKDPGLAETIARAKESLTPFAAVIKTSSRVEIIPFLDKLAGAAAAGQWPVAGSTAMIIRNVIVAEAARDERYVRLNSLEYILLDFGSKFYEVNAEAMTVDISSIPVKFASTEQHKLAMASNASAVAVGDFDLNGTLDGATLAGSQVVVTFPLQGGNATEIVKTTVEVGEGFERLLAIDLDDDADLKLKDQLQGSGCAVADLDLLVYGSGGVKGFDNRPADATKSRDFILKPLGEVLDGLRDIRSIVPADLDLDGDLDLLTITRTGIRLWSNRGNWSFEEITDRSKLPPESFVPTAAVVVDWDRDTDQDLLVSGRDGFGIMENIRHGRFRWRALEGEFSSLKDATSLAVVQIGQVPSWSVIGAGAGGVQSVVTETTVAGLVSAKRHIKISEHPAETAMSLDYDNDGIRDLLVVEPSGAGLYRGKSDGTFALLSPSAAGDLKGVRSAAICDVDRDGDEDLILAAGDNIRWHSNEGGNANGWLDVALSGVQIKANEQNYSRRVNHYGIGSMIEIRAGAQYQVQVVQGATTHFGLGPQKKADVIRVMWTNGMPQNAISPTPNQLICEEQKLVGSCPYLYTWDGEKFVFCTDLLWNAPLGLKFAEDVVAPWREWEYLKIDGRSSRRARA